MSEALRRRLQAAKTAVATHQMVTDTKDEPYDIGIIDLLANIRHYCDSEGLDYYLLDKLAYGRYLETKD